MKKIFSDLINTSESAILACTLTDSNFCDLLWGIQIESPKTVTRVCRGVKMRNLDSLFDEFSAALQFPYYFGENWPAFNECITDLSWLPAEAYILGISDAEFLLSDSDKADFGTFFKILQNAFYQWKSVSAEVPKRESPTPFHVLLQFDIGHEGEMQKKFSSINIDLLKIITNEAQ